jgi:endonuclease YncB( thermonuclease family)
LALRKIAGMAKAARKLLFAVCCGVVWLSPGSDAFAECALSEPEAAQVASVVDGETLKLADGRTLRLIGAKAPLAPLRWRGDDPWPMVEEAREALARLVPPGATIELRFGGSRSDRYDHILAQAFVVDGAQRTWLQEKMVGQGLARVYSFPDNRACVAELLAREADARAKRRGIWHVAVYRVRDALDVERLGRLTFSYQIVEGRVAAVGGRGRVYLNFTDDWTTDFTVEIERKAMPLFAKAGIDPKALAGKRIRVRGWIAWRNGPMIEATHPEQIELLPEPVKPAKPEPLPDDSIAL